MDNILGELLADSLKCVCCFDKNEDLFNLDVNELKMVSEKMSTNDKKVYVFSDGQRKEIPNELVMKYQDSLLYMIMNDVESRANGHEVDVDSQFHYLDEIIKYMNNEYDIFELDGIAFDEFCGELMEMNIPFRMDIMHRLYTGSNEYGVGWKNQYMMVQGHEYTELLNYMNLKLGELKYDGLDRIEVIKSKPVLQHANLIACFEKYLKNPDQYVKSNSFSGVYVQNQFADIGFDTSNEVVRKFLRLYQNSFIFGNTKILNFEYADSLRQWFGDCRYKLIYRASEHNYTASSFHKYCDNKGPTLVVIKSKEGFVFGGFTAKSWRREGGNSMFYSNRLRIQ